MISVKQQGYREFQLGPYLLGSSLTVNVGDAVAFSDAAATAGTLTNDTAKVAGTAYVVGVVTQIVDKDGNPFLASDGTELKSVTTGASNTTYYAMIVPSMKGFLMEFDVNATLGTTTGSNKPGGYFNLADARTIAENSYVAAGAAGSPKQVFSLGPVIDPVTGAVSTNKILGFFTQSVQA